MNNDQGKSGRSLSPISEVLAKSLGEKINAVCRDCGETFEATNLGRLTATICSKCGTKREEQEQAMEKLAQEQAEEQRYRELIRLANIPPRWREVTFREDKIHTLPD